MLERRPKRKCKSRIAMDKYGSTEISNVPLGRKPAPTFQKKLVVIDYMGGLTAPRSFAVKEIHVWVRGILPEIELTATEKEVRKVVGEVISNSDSILGPNSFEFMEASGKCLCIPAQKTNFPWTGRAVKQLAGTGAVYIRLTEARLDDSDFEGLVSDDSTDSLPIVKVTKRDSAGTVPPAYNIIFYGLSICLCKMLISQGILRWG